MVHLAYSDKFRKFTTQDSAKKNHQKALLTCCQKRQKSIPYL